MTVVAIIIPTAFVVGDAGLEAVIARSCCRIKIPADVNYPKHIAYIASQHAYVIGWL